MKTEIKDCLNFCLTYVVTLWCYAPFSDKGKAMVMLLFFSMLFLIYFAISYLIFSGFLKSCGYSIGFRIKLFCFLALAEAIAFILTSTSPTISVLRQLTNRSETNWTKSGEIIAKFVATVTASMAFYVLGKRRKLVALTDAF